jgi:peptide/nickel transport system substrate-binding protein
MRNLTKAGAVAAAVAILLAGCSSTPASNSSGSGKGGTLTILTPQTTINLDPAKSQNLATTSLSLLDRRLTTWEVKPGQPAKVVPDLATNTGTESDSGKTWTYTLKDGLKFQDGSAITSEDIKYGVERSFSDQLTGGLGYHKTLLVGGAGYKGPYSGADLPSIETPNAKTIVFHLNASYGDWPWIVSMPAFTPVPKAKDNPATYGNSPVASGPYQVQSNKDGTALTLVRNKYWSAKTDSVRTADPDTIVFKENQSQSTTVQSLISDTAEAKSGFGAQFLGAAELAQVKNNPSAKARLATSQAGPISYLAMNTQRGALKQLSVRQALEYAVDKKAFLIASGGADAGIPATTMITPGIAGRKQFNLYPAGADGDVAKAKQLLAKSTDVSNLNLTFLVQNDPSSLAQGQAIQQGIERTGIKVTLKPEDQNSFYTDASANAGDFDLVLFSWQPDFPSANSNIQPLFASSQIGNGAYNVSHYSNPAVDTLIDQATAETNPSKAQQLWAQADKKIMEDAPVVPLAYAKQSFLHGSNVQNFFIPSFPAYPDYMTVTLAK